MLALTPFLLAASCPPPQQQSGTLERAAKALAVAKQAHIEAERACRCCAVRTETLIEVQSGTERAGSLEAAKGVANLGFTRAQTWTQGGFVRQLIETPAPAVCSAVTSP